MSDNDIIIEQVKENYGAIALRSMKGNSCCGENKEVLSLGCFTSLVEKAELKKGQIVLDLGSGPGSDLIKSAEIIGTEGKAIGLDMTQEMLELGRKNTSHLSNVTIIEGNLMKIPLEDNSVDVVISNCVFNLTTDKAKAFKEAYRVLKKGGKIVESDVALEYDLPEEDRNKQQVYSGCIGGAISINKYLDYMKSAGFENIVAEKQFESTYNIDGKEYPYVSVLFSARKN